MGGAESERQALPEKEASDSVKEGISSAHVGG